MKKLTTFTSLTLCGLLLAGCTSTTPPPTTSTNTSSIQATDEVLDMKSFTEEQFQENFNQNLTTVFNSEIYQELLSSYDDLGSLENGEEVFKVALEMIEHLGERLEVIPTQNIKFQGNQLKFAYELISGKTVSNVPNYVTTENMNKVNHLLDMVTYANYAKEVSETLANMADGIAVEELKFGAEGQANIKLLKDSSKSVDDVIYINQAGLYLETKTGEILMSPSLPRALAYYKDEDDKPYLDTFGDAASKISEGVYVDSVVDRDISELISEVINELNLADKEINEKNLDKAFDGREIKTTFEDTDITNAVTYKDASGSVDENSVGEYVLNVSNPRGENTKQTYIYNVQNSQKTIPAASVGRQDFSNNDKDLLRFSFMWNFVGTTFYSELYDKLNTYDLADFNSLIKESVKKEFDDPVKEGFYPEDEYLLESIGKDIYKISIKPNDGFFEGKKISTIFNLSTEAEEEAVG